MNKNNKIWLSTTYYQQPTNQQHASHQHYLYFAFVISLEHELSRGGEVPRRGFQEFFQKFCLIIV